MTVKEMQCVHSAIWHAKEIIEQLGCQDYPYTEFYDEDFKKMFYALNKMDILILEKIDLATAK